MTDKKKAKSHTITVTISMTDKLQDIFKKHIGLLNGISPNDILRLLYGNSIFNETLYYRDYMWRHKVLRAIHYLRHRTKLFVISQKIDRESKPLFFVVQTEEEGTIFNKRLDREIKGMHKTQIRCKKAVSENWWRNLK